MKFDIVFTKGSFCPRLGLQRQRRIFYFGRYLNYYTRKSFSNLAEIVTPGKSLSMHQMYLRFYENGADLLYFKGFAKTHLSIIREKKLLRVISSQENSLLNSIISIDFL